MKLPQLTVRDLFWLVLVCGLACGWWAEAYRQRTMDYEYAKKIWAFEHIESVLEHELGARVVLNNMEAIRVTHPNGIVREYRPGGRIDEHWSQIKQADHNAQPLLLFAVHAGFVAITSFILLRLGPPEADPSPPTLN